MNENILKATVEAGFSVIEDGVYGQRWYKSQCGFNLDEFENFAKFLVKKVIDKAEDYGLGCDAVEQLKEDFGVDDE